VLSIDRRNLALPAILAVATVIIVNAVVAQDGKHPAPIANNGSHQKITKSQTPILKSKVLKRKSGPAKTVTVTPRKKPVPNAAKVPDDAIGQLLKQAAGNGKHKTPARTSLLDEKKVRFVQTRLAQFGYAPGPVDGIFGQQTRDAIKKFESDRKIPVTGEISRALIEALSRSASFASLERT